jgi:hypothetical protein
MFASSIGEGYPLSGSLPCVVTRWLDINGCHSAFSSTILTILGTIPYQRTESEFDKSKIALQKITTMPATPKKTYGGQDAGDSLPPDPLAADVEMYPGVAFDDHLTTNDHHAADLLPSDVDISTLGALYVPVNEALVPITQNKASGHQSKAGMHEKSAATELPCKFEQLHPHVQAYLKDNSLKTYLKQNGLREFHPSMLVEFVVRLVFDRGFPAPTMSTLMKMPLPMGELARVVETLSWWLKDEPQFYRSQQIEVPFRSYGNVEIEVPQQNRELFDRAAFGVMVHGIGFGALVRLPSAALVVIFWQTLKAAEQAERTRSIFLSSASRPGWESVCDRHVDNKAGNTGKQAVHDSNDA